MGLGRQLRHNPCILVISIGAASNCISTALARLCEVGKTGAQPLRFQVQVPMPVDECLDKHSQAVRALGLAVIKTRHIPSEEVFNIDAQGISYFNKLRDVEAAFTTLIFRHE